MFVVFIQLLNCFGVGCILLVIIIMSQYCDLQGNVCNDLVVYVMNVVGFDGGQVLLGNLLNFIGVFGLWSLFNVGGSLGVIVMCVGFFMMGYVDILFFYKLDGSWKLIGIMQVNGQNIIGVGNILLVLLNMGLVIVSIMIFLVGNSFKIVGIVLYGDFINIVVCVVFGGFVYMQDMNGNYVVVNVGNVNVNGNVSVSGNVNVLGIMLVY